MNLKRKKFRKTTTQRSSFEAQIKDNLEKRKIKHGYETIRLTYTKHECPHCGKVVTTGTYTPDFIIERSSGIRLICEGKGYFDSEDRRKMQLVKRDNPNEDIRFLFQRDQPIRRGSKTTYSKWCLKNGFDYAIGIELPEEWLF